MKMMRYRSFLLLLWAVMVAGCDRQTASPSAPSPEIISGMTRDRTSFTFLKWNEGLAIMLVDHCDAHHMSGSSSSGKPDQRKGEAYSWNQDSSERKIAYGWQLETTDGRTAVFAVNNVEYDLSQGAVFRIGTAGGQPTVTQINRDLSSIQADMNACDHFVTSTPELRNPVKGSDHK
jgi:hypothetical protein